MLYLFQIIYATVGAQVVFFNYFTIDTLLAKSSKQWVKHGKLTLRRKRAMKRTENMHTKPSSPEISLSSDLNFLAKTLCRWRLA